MLEFEGFLLETALCSCSFDAAVDLTYAPHSWGKPWLKDATFEISPPPRAVGMCRGVATSEPVDPTHAHSAM